MSRMRILGLLTAVGVVGLLAGCQMGTSMSYDQKIVAVVTETSRDNSAEVTISVDGQDKMGPVAIAPGATRELTIHDPSGDSPVRLSPNERHRISWKLHRKGSYGKVGSLELNIYAGKSLITSASTKYVWPGFFYWWFTDIKLEQTKISGPGPIQPKQPIGPMPPKSTTPPPSMPPSMPPSTTPPSGPPSMPRSNG